MSKLISNSQRFQCRKRNWMKMALSMMDLVKMIYPGRKNPGRRHSQVVLKMMRMMLTGKDQKRGGEMGSD